MPHDSPGSHIFESQLRAVMCFSLSAALSIWSKGERPHLSDAEAWPPEPSHAASFLWRARPKHHHIAHLLNETRRWKLNPMAASTFLDEDHMKQLRGVSSACHPKTMLKAWARRYILKRSLSRWSGESEIPEKMVWFKEVLDVDENGEINGNERESGMAMRMVLTSTGGFQTPLLIFQQRK